jgi:hypothetical protein
MKKCIAALCFCLALLIGQGAANPAPIHIGHGLIGNMNPHETGAIVLGITTIGALNLAYLTSGVLCHPEFGI